MTSLQILLTIIAIVTAAASYYSDGKRLRIFYSTLFGIAATAFTFSVFSGALA